MREFKLKFLTYGDRGVLIEWPKEIANNILQDRLLFQKKIQKHCIKQIVDVIPAYNSLLIVYINTIDNFYELENNLRALYNQEIEINNQSNYKWIIPVCYEDEFGIDLADFSFKKGISKKMVIDMHTNALYTVHFIGFLPGFLYLGGLDEKLHLARKSSPNLNIKKGSVAIGGSQTGIYPINSPGGWHIIGNSPINWFDVSNENPCFASAGDKIKFQPINRSIYNDIVKKVLLNQYQLEKEVIDD